MTDILNKYYFKYITYSEYHIFRVSWVQHLFKTPNDYNHARTIFGLLDIFQTFSSQHFIILDFSFP